MVAIPLHSQFELSPRTLPGRGRSNIGRLKELTRNVLCRFSLWHRCNKASSLGLSGTCRSNAALLGADLVGGDSVCKCGWL